MLIVLAFTDNCPLLWGFFSVQGPRFPDPSLMGEQGPRPPMPTGFPGPPMDQTRMVYRQGAPSYGPGKTVKK